MRKRICKLSQAIQMATVNGPLTVEDGLTVTVPSLDRKVEFIVVKDSPSPQRGQAMYVGRIRFLLATTADAVACISFR